MISGSLVLVQLFFLVGGRVPFLPSDHHVLLALPYCVGTWVLHGVSLGVVGYLGGLRALVSHGWLDPNLLLLLDWLGAVCIFNLLFTFTRILKK